jgi:hypothetical protein
MQVRRSIPEIDDVSKLPGHSSIRVTEEHNAYRARGRRGAGDQPRRR